MAKLKYVGEYPEGRDEITQYGYKFSEGEAVDIKDADLDRFAGNRFFVSVAERGRPKSDKD